MTLNFTKRSYLALLLLASLVLPFSANPSTPSSLSELYQEAEAAQNAGHYSSFLQKLSQEDPEFLLQKLSKRLNRLMRLGPQERFTALQQILHYYSSKHGAFKPRALDMESRLGVSVESLAKNGFNPSYLAIQLVDSVLNYEDEVTLPLSVQIESHLRQHYPDQILFFIGRDFSIVHTILNARSRLPNSLLLNLNVSRKVRDLILARNSTDAFAHLLRDQGLTPSRAVSQGIVFMDSSMSGKIPKAILYSLFTQMSGPDIEKLARRTDIVLVKSKQNFPDNRTVLSVDQLIMSFIRSNSQFDLRGYKKQVLDANLRIPSFPLQLPKVIANYPKDHLHNLFEHRYKFLTSSDRIIADSGSQNFKIASPPPKDLAEEINSLLGLIAEIHLWKSANAPVSDALSQSFNDSNWIGPDSSELKLIDELRAKGTEHLMAWANTSDAKAHRLLAHLNLRPTKDKDFPFELVFKGQRLYRLKGRLGEGRNLSVYLTENNTALKVLKDSHGARKQLLASWMQAHLDRYKIPYAPILRTHRTGVIQEQVWIPGVSIETMYQDGERLSADLKEQVLHQWKKAIQLIESENLWLDFRSGNFQINEDGNPVLVDFVPRLKGEITRYYRPDPDSLEWLSTKEFFKRFLLHHLSRGHQPNRPDACLINFQPDSNKGQK